MSNFKARMHQILFWLGLRPRSCLGSLERFSDPIVGLTGPWHIHVAYASKAREWDGKGGNEIGRRKEGGCWWGKFSRWSNIAKLSSVFYANICIYICFCFLTLNGVIIWFLFFRPMLFVFTRVKCWLILYYYKRSPMNYREKGEGKKGHPRFLPGLTLMDTASGLHGIGFATHFWFSPLANLPEGLCILRALI